MFVLQDRERKWTEVLLEQPELMWELLADDEPSKYPQWSALDSCSATTYGSEDMDGLIADLEKLKSAQEMAARRQRWRQRLEDEAAKIVAEQNRRYSSTMWSPPPDPRLDELRATLRALEHDPDAWPTSLREELVVPYVDSIIGFAQMCREIGGLLTHNPFQKEE